MAKWYATPICTWVYDARVAERQSMADEKPREIEKRFYEAFRAAIEDHDEVRWVDGYDPDYLAEDYDEMTVFSVGKVKYNFFTKPHFPDADRVDAVPWMGTLLREVWPWQKLFGTRVDQVEPSIAHAVHELLQQTEGVSEIRWYTAEEHMTRAEGRRSPR